MNRLVRVAGPIPLLLLAANVWGGTPSAAPLEEVLVTARLREQPLEQLPSSVTVLDSRTLELAGVQHFEDVLGLVPNLNWSSGTSRPRYFQLRGIGELEQYQGAPNPSVGFLIDDMDFSGIGTPATLFDVAQIEVLRGPQGAAYGANALAGLVNVRTQDPRPDFELRGELTSGDYGTNAAGGLIGGAVGQSGDAAYRLVVQHYRSDGFFTNAFLGRAATNGFDETTSRLKYHWAHDVLAFDVTALYVNLDNGYDAFSLDNSRVTQSDQPGRDAQLSKGLATRLTYTALEGVTLRNIATYVNSAIVYSFDDDWQHDPTFAFFTQYLRSRRTWSEELRATSAPDAWFGGRASWVAGLYVLDAREGNNQLDTQNGAMLDTLVSDYHSRNTAGYGQLDVQLTPRGSLSMGLRGEHRHALYLDSQGSDFDPGETMWGGHVSYEFTWSPQRRIYATLSRGYKAGGFNIGALVPVERRQFSAEYLWNLESGFTLRTADARLESTWALFYMRREHEQVPTSFQLDPANPASFLFITDNAARGENFGVEGSVRWHASERLEFDATLGLLHTRYIGYQFSDQDGFHNLDGRAQAHAPPYQYSISALWHHPSGLFARADLQGVDAFYYDASNEQKSNPYFLANVKLGYENPHWSATAWARNLFNTTYAMRGFFFNNLPVDAPPQRYVQLGDPRQFGVTLTYSLR
ncbi:MAG TPA: TonB-dependent receptor plug domain-containing protein [Steroidobacteraceae bacterium]